MLQSYYAPLCTVVLPYAGRQRYMHSFDLAHPKMAEGFEDYLEPVAALCEAAGAIRGTAHMTVDEKIIQPGMSQRRPGPHVDGCYIPAVGKLGHGNWNHYCNHLPGEAVARMPIIVASSVPGCRAWRGEFEGAPKNDGDLSHLSLPEGEVLPASVGYLLSPDCVHESMRFAEPTARTFLRIALPVDFPWRLVVG